ncbi:restriction endonuclease subunit S [Staphylococcus saprophyticus]
MTNDVKNVPEWRFAGFVDEWEKKLLNEIANVQMGQSPNSKNYTDDSQEMILVQGNADLKNGKVFPRIFTKEITKLANIGDILLSVRAPVGEIGISQMPVCIGRGVCSITSNLFIYYFLDYFNNENKWKKFSQGSTFESISGNEVRSLIIYSPSKTEQQKIGDFFSKLDRQIELEEQKLAKLEEQKKGYMQKIFSQELRFKDGNGNNYSEWIKTNLKFLVSYKNGKGYEKEVVQNGKYNIINLNSISTKGMLKDSGKYSDFEDITLKKNDLIMILSDVAKGNLIGKAAIIDQDDKYLLNQRVASLRIKDESTSNVLFIYYFINYFRQYFINMSTGMSQLNINKSTVEDFLIYLPYIEEQDKIGNFFSNLDKSIIKQLDKIELLKERKKGFLQKMFV